MVVSRERERERARELWSWSRHVHPLLRRARDAYGSGGDSDSNCDSGGEFASMAQNQSSPSAPFPSRPFWGSCLGHQSPPSLRFPPFEQTLQADDDDCAFPSQGGGHGPRASLPKWAAYLDIVFISELLLSSLVVSFRDLFLLLLLQATFQTLISTKLKRFWGSLV